MSASIHDDWHAIVAGLNRLAAIFDAREWDRVGEVLADDATAYGAEGLDAIVTTNLRQFLGGCGPSQHLLGNYEVEVDGDRAVSHTKARVFHQGAGERADRTWECFGVYHDTWARTPAGWRLTERVFDVHAAVGDFEVLQPG